MISALARDVEHILAHKKATTETLRRVQSRNDENFFLLGNEVKKTQENNSRCGEQASSQFNRSDQPYKRTTDSVQSMPYDTGATFYVPSGDKKPRIGLGIAVYPHQGIPCCFLRVQNQLILDNFFSRRWSHHAVILPPRRNSCHCKRFIRG